MTFIIEAVHPTRCCTCSQGRELINKAHYSTVLVPTTAHVYKLNTETKLNVQVIPVIPLNRISVINIYVV